MTEALEEEMSERRPTMCLIAYTHGEKENIDPEDPPVYGALGCFESASSYELWKADRQLSDEEREKKRERLLRETSGRGHGSVLDQARFIICGEDLSRMTTLFICQLQHAEFLQQSLRRASASRGVELPAEIEVSPKRKDVHVAFEEAFSLYRQMVEAGIPAEDARIILPLATRTNIQMSINPRELMHLHFLSEGKQVPSTVRRTVEQMVECVRDVAPRLIARRDASYEPLAWYPCPQMFVENNHYIDRTLEHCGQGVEKTILVGESEVRIPSELMAELARAVERRDPAALSFLKHYHYTFLSRMSLMTAHQAIRQRTWDQSFESIYQAAKRGDYIVPPSFNRIPALLQKYDDQARKMLELYRNLVMDGVSPRESISVVPHSLAIYDLIHINGWNAIHSIGKRTCTEAQWEIRGIAQDMANVLRTRNPVFEKFAQPQGIVYGKCPEKKSCGYCQRSRS